MGQALSRRVIPHLQKAMQRQERDTVKEALQEIAEKERTALSTTRYSDPSSLIGGFTRGGAPLSDATDGEKQRAAVHMQKDKRQEDFLKRKNANTPDEMPEELLNFLNDMGPVKRSVDKSLTSSRILKKIDDEGEDNVMKSMEEEQRKKQRQLWSTHTVALTANIPDDDKNNNVEVNNKHASRLSADSGLKSEHGPEEEETASYTYDEEELTNVLKKSLEGEKGENVDNIELQNALGFLSFPVIMRDTDDELVGAWPNRVEDLKKIGLKIVTGSEVSKS